MEKLSVQERSDYIHKILQNMIDTEDLRNTQIIKNNATNNKVAVIVEPRRHKFMEAVIRNVMYFLPKDEWNLHVITSAENRDWLKTLFLKWDFQITTINQSNLNLDEYSSLLTSQQFWENITEENVLIFQTDVILFHSNINDFIDYDFIGANFFDENDTSVNNGGNNGGFSFRHKSAMLDCIHNVSIRNIQNYQIMNGKRPKNNMSEDVYFTYACEILNKKMCPVEDRPKFSIEDGRKEFYDKPLGCHRLNSCEFGVILTNVLSKSLLSKYVP